MMKIVLPLICMQYFGSISKMNFNKGLHSILSLIVFSYFPQIRALQKTGHSATHPALAGEPQPDGVPPGYELVSLVEALNEPLLHAAAPPPPPLQLFHHGDGAAGALAAASGGANNNKKRSKRRGSKDPQHSAASSSSRDHRGTRVGEKGSCSSSPPPVEDPR
jgi:hypothetical protein